MMDFPGFASGQIDSSHVRSVKDINTVSAYKKEELLPLFLSFFVLMKRFNCSFISSVSVCQTNRTQHILNQPLF